MNESISVKIVNKSNNDLPQYGTVGSAGIDLKAALIPGEELIIKPGERVLVGTGLFIGLPVGYEAQIRPRSGLAIKHGITVLNSPGTIDSDYRGEIKVILINHSNEKFRVMNGDRICQMVITKYDQVCWETVESLDSTERGEGGFGHTGK